MYTSSLATFCPLALLAPPFFATLSSHFPICPLTHLTFSGKPTLSFSPLTLPGFHQGALAVTSCTVLLFSGPGTLRIRPHMTVSSGFLPRSISVEFYHPPRAYQQTWTLSTQAQARNLGWEREGSKVPVLMMHLV
ncbi:hypothetical protein HJG60_010564 [Phyllostomus discolor]|uniref:Uncharacterized protein n=1 Tax=Phyllostomus discolor TaxID=89673 RepID=A0A834APK4_9CHIR|nr:hypothetical protein HJG60_010564 [Phyllostomus discolor]